MDELTQRAGFLNGLLAAMDTSRDPEAARIASAVADLLTALTERVCTHDTLLDELNDYVESIDDDLAALEGEAPDSGDNDSNFDDDFEDAPAQLHLVNGNAPRRDEDPAGRVCPECHTVFLVSSADRPGLHYKCPGCGCNIVPEFLSPDNAVIIRPSDD